MNFGNVNELDQQTQKKCFSLKSGSTLFPEAVSPASASPGRMAAFDPVPVSTLPHSLPQGNPLTSYIHALLSVTPIQLSPSFGGENDQRITMEESYLTRSFFSALCATLMSLTLLTITAPPLLSGKIQWTSSMLFEQQTCLCLLMASSSPALLTSQQGCIVLHSFWVTGGQGGQYQEGDWL